MSSFRRAAAGLGVLGALPLVAAAVPAAVALGSSPGALLAGAGPPAQPPSADAAQERAAPTEPAVPRPLARRDGPLAGLPSTVPGAPATGPWFDDRIVTEYSDAFPANLVSATRDYTFEARLAGAAGRPVEVQRRAADGDAWETVDSAALALGRARLTIPAVGRHVALDYRLVLPATGTDPEVAGDVQHIQHYRADDLPHDDVAWTVSQVIAPYCQNTPVVAGDDAQWELLSPGAVVQGAAYAHPDYPDLEIIYISDSFQWYADEDLPRPTHTKVALHECGHIVSRTALGERFDAELAAAYPDVEEGYRTEAIAEALTDHWAAVNPGGNASRWFVPFTEEGTTFLATNGSPFAPHFPFDIVTYPGDDALVERLTAAALARNDGVFGADPAR